MQTHHLPKQTTVQPAARGRAGARTSAQGTIEDRRPASQTALQLQEMANNTSPAAHPNGLPTDLRQGMENLSGYDLGDVRVHYNSAVPAQLNAHAYAQGADIHLAAGQEQHLPHEAWHVVQQRQGRVRPSVEVNGQPVNDDARLESEADRMGARAAQRMALAPAAQLKRVRSGRGAVQRKVNNLTALPGGDPFANGTWPGIGAEIDAYNLLAPDDARYASQREQLIKLATAARTQMHKDEPMLEQAVTDLKAELDVRVDAYLDALVGTFLNFEKKLPDAEEAASERAEEMYDSWLGKKAELDEAAALNNALLSFESNCLEGEIRPELIAVIGQMTGETTAGSAVFETLEEGTKIGKSFRKPARINALTKKVTAEENSLKKLKLVDELQELIVLWRKDHVDPATAEIKAGITGTDRDEAMLALQAILLIEQQLPYTRNAAYQGIFKTAPTASAGSNRAEGFGIASSLLSGGSAGAKSVKTGMGLGEQVDVFTPGWEKETVLGAELLPKTEEGLGASSIVGSGADLLGQMIKLKDIGADWQKAKGKMATASFFADKVSAISTGLNDAASIAETGINLAEKGRSAVSGFNAKDTFGKISEMTGDITAGIMALKNVFLGVKYVYEAHRRKGVDGQQSFTYGAKGAIAFVQAAEGGMKLAASVLKSFYSIAPEPLLRTIPIVGIALEVASGLLNLYTAVKAGQAKKKAVNFLAPFAGEDGVVTAASLVRHTRNTPAEIGLITKTEQRGVMGGKETYLRFSPYVMAKIDDHVTGPDKASNLTIQVDGAQAVILTPNTVAAIREYEYASKMTEINQKRKVSGLQLVIKSVIGLAGKITTAAGVTAMIGTAIGAGVTASSVVNTVAKGGQKISRNKRRTALDAQLPVADAGIAGFPSQDAYTTARGPKTDRSAQQKGTEYARHAFYIMDRITLMPNPPELEAPADAMKVALAGGAQVTDLLTSTGVDLFLFLSASNVTDRINLLIAAQKAGR